MSEWTKEPPTEAGWYWLRAPTEIIDIVLVGQDVGPERKMTCKYHTMGMDILISEMNGGEWWPEQIKEPPK